MNEKTRKIIGILLLLLILAGFGIIVRKAYVIGGRIACENSGAILIEGFKCEEVIEQDPLWIINFSEGT